MFNAATGYGPCPCRDCFEVAIDGLCLACGEVGCSAAGDSACEAELDTVEDADEIADAEDPQPLTATKVQS